MMMGASLIFSLSLSSSLPEQCQVIETFLMRRDSLQNGLLTRKEYGRSAFAQEQKFLAGFTLACWKEYARIFRDRSGDSIATMLAIRVLSDRIGNIPTQVRDSLTYNFTQLIQSQECPPILKARILENIPLVANSEAARFLKPFVLSTDENISNAATHALIRVIWNDRAGQKCSTGNAPDTCGNSTIKQEILTVYSEFLGSSPTVQQTKILAAIAAHGAGQ